MLWQFYIVCIHKGRFFKKWLTLFGMQEDRVVHRVLTVTLCNTFVVNWTVWKQDQCFSQNLLCLRKSRTLQLSSQTLLKTHQEKGTLISQLRPVSCFLNNMFNIKTLNTTRPHSLLNLPHYSFSWKAGRLLFIDFIHWDKVTLTQLFKLNVACKTKWNIWLSDCSAIRSDFLPPVSH